MNSPVFYVLFQSVFFIFQVQITQRVSIFVAHRLSSRIPLISILSAAEHLACFYIAMESGLYFIWSEASEDTFSYGDLINKKSFSIILINFCNTLSRTLLNS